MRCVSKYDKIHICFYAQMSYIIISSSNWKFSQLTELLTACIKLEKEINNHYETSISYYKHDFNPFKE